jgi:hypothetical protein
MRHRTGNVEYIERRSVAREALLILDQTRSAAYPRDIKRAVIERGAVSADGVQRELRELVRRGLASYADGSWYRITEAGRAVLGTVTGNTVGMGAVLFSLRELEGISRRYAGSMTSGAASLSAAAVQLTERIAAAEAILQKRDNELEARARDLRRREARLRAAEKKARVRGKREGSEPK